MRNPDPWTGSSSSRSRKLIGNADDLISAATRRLAGAPLLLKIYYGHRGGELILLAERSS
jgi:hypothetical protein